MASNQQPPRPANEPRIKSTLAFRIINPELFIKPNKFVMAFGLFCIGGCALFLFNMNFGKYWADDVTVTLGATE